MRGGKLPSMGLVLAGVFLAGGMGSTDASNLVTQTALPGACIPEFAVPLPVFGPGGIPRSAPGPYRGDAGGQAGGAPRSLEVKYPTTYFDAINQVVEKCPSLNFQDTRVWAYKTSDTNTGRVLGAARWPAVTVGQAHRPREQICFRAPLDIE